MLGTILAFSLLLTTWQTSHTPKVNRIFVATPFNASIIFEYAHVALPEDQSLREGAVDCLVRELKATGLFRDVRVELKPTSDGQKVDVDITPDWEARSQNFLIDGIDFEGFTGIDEEKLRVGLRQKGLAVGVPLLQHPVSEIKEAVRHISREMSHTDKNSVQAIEQVLDELSLRVIPIATERVKLVIASDHRELCPL